MRIVLDTTILVRATDRSHGPAREVLLRILKGSRGVQAHRTFHTLLLSSEMLHELAAVLRHPRLQMVFGLSEEQVYAFVALLRESAEVITLSPLLITPIRDVNDIAVAQTAILGGADVLCTRDEDFFDAAMTDFLGRAGIVVMDEIALLDRLRD